MRYLNKYAEINYRQSLYLACRGVLRVKQADSSGILKQAGPAPKTIKYVRDLSYAAAQALAKPKAKRTPEDVEAIEGFMSVSQHPAFKDICASAFQQRAQQIETQVKIKGSNSLNGVSFGGGSATGGTQNTNTVTDSIQVESGNQKTTPTSPGGPPTPMMFGIPMGMPMGMPMGGMPPGAVGYYVDPKTGQPVFIDAERRPIGPDGKPIVKKKKKKPKEEAPAAAAQTSEGTLYINTNGTGILKTHDGKYIQLNPDEVQQYKQLHPEVDEQITNNSTPAETTANGTQTTAPNGTQTTAPNGTQTTAPNGTQTTAPTGTPDPNAGAGTGSTVVNSPGDPNAATSSTVNSPEATSSAVVTSPGATSSASTIDPGTGEVTTQNPGGGVTVTDTNGNRTEIAPHTTGDVSTDITTVPANSDTGGPGEPPSGPPNNPNATGNQGPTDADYEAMHRTDDRNKFVNSFVKRKNDEFDKRWSGAGVASGIGTGIAGYLGAGAIGDKISDNLLGKNNRNTWKSRLLRWGARLLGAAGGFAGGYYGGKGLQRNARQEGTKAIGRHVYDKYVTPTLVATTPEEDPTATRTVSASYGTKLVNKLKNNVGYTYYFVNRK